MDLSNVNNKMFNRFAYKYAKPRKPVVVEEKSNNTRKKKKNDPEQQERQFMRQAERLLNQRRPGEIPIWIKNTLFEPSEEEVAIANKKRQRARRFGGGGASGGASSVSSSLDGLRRSKSNDSGLDALHNSRNNLRSLATVPANAAGAGDGSAGSTTAQTTPDSPLRRSKSNDETCLRDIRSLVNGENNKQEDGTSNTGDKKAPEPPPQPPPEPIMKPYEWKRGWMLPPASESAEESLGSVKGGSAPQSTSSKPLTSASSGPSPPPKDGVDEAKENTNDTTKYTIRLRGRIDQGEDKIKTKQLTEQQKDDPSLILLANDPAIRPPNDLVELEHFTEPALVECLERRFKRGQVYTATGPVLIALNPFQFIPDLYSDDQMKEYWDRAEQGLSGNKLPPHVFEKADDAFRNMMRGMELNLAKKRQNQEMKGASSQQQSSTGVIKVDQSILVSGESGAGKTVTTKHLMKYLTALSQRAAQQACQKTSARMFLSKEYQDSKKNKKKKKSATTTKDGTEETTNGEQQSLSSAKKLSASIEDQVLQSNPILEAFGNARTVRNDNSSRFGKFIQMQFTETGRLVGTCIDTYLLEKVRLVHQGPGERNYHVFYQLLAEDALSHEEIVHLKLEGYKPQDFSITNQSGTYDRRDGVSDVQTYTELLGALTVMGFSNHDRMNALGVTAAILHASNLSFEEVSSEECGLKRDNVHLQPACELLGVTADALNRALCYYTIVVLGEKCQRPQLQSGAQKGLEALMKAAYGALFTYLVTKVNELVSFHDTKGGTRPAACIDILDIFGFESFETNSFEQLCINYCNEVLQQQFNSAVLQKEQAEYAAEGIDWDFIKFPENQDVLDLICDRKGVLSVLDDMCRAPSATDTSFANQLIAMCGRRDRFTLPTKQRSGAPRFIIQHYAGSVEYLTEGFLEKNRDDLPRETTDLLMSSHNPFVHKLAEIIAAETEPSAGVTANGGASSNKAKTSSSANTRPTVGGHFQQQVKDLRAKIDRTSPNYVRCIKPNGLLVPKKFDQAMVAEQLRCGGVLQAVSVTRDGFTLHYTFADFVSRYGNLTKEEDKGAALVDRGTGKAAMKAICRDLVGVLLKELKEEEEREKEREKAEAEANKNSGGDDDGESSGPKGDSNPEDEADEVLIQFGKTKVLLKHHAFEALECRLRSVEDKAATRLNSVFRRHLAMMAFVVARKEFRRHLTEDLGYESFEIWFKHERELYYQSKGDKSDLGLIPNITKNRLEMYQKNCTTSTVSSTGRPSSPTLENGITSTAAINARKFFNQSLVPM